MALRAHKRVQIQQVKGLCAACIANASAHGRQHWLAFHVSSWLVVGASLRQPTHHHVTGSMLVIRHWLVYGQQA
jgi:hypothetical protein